MTSSIRKIKQAAFPLDAALFTTGELAAVSGLSRAMADTWISEGRLLPTRRVKTSAKGRGKSMFSAIAITGVAIRVYLGSSIGIGLSEWGKLGEEIGAMNIADLAEHVTGGNWYWAVARGVDNNKPFKFCIYARYSDRGWMLDSSVGDKMSQPCFGVDTPFLFVPVWKIFSDVYTECKKLLGTSGNVAGSKGKRR